MSILRQTVYCASRAGGGGGGGSCESFLLPMDAHNTVRKRKCTCGDLGEPNDHCFV